MGVAGSPPAERAGGRHHQIAGASDPEAPRPPGGDTRIGCAACTAGEELLGALVAGNQVE